jgi:hypothetical protein
MAHPLNSVSHQQDIKFITCSKRGTLWITYLTWHIRSLTDQKPLSNQEHILLPAELTRRLTIASKMPPADGVYLLFLLIITC